MPKWTEEQLSAIHQDHSNIIVSAGAGSGKTAVLSERVIRKLQDGVDIDHLLLLTFTKAASLEMKERIRSKISKIPELKAQLDLIDASYITTFDSFALSVVKKYHYLLNISSTPQIADQSMMLLKKKELLTNIFDEYYGLDNPSFNKLIYDFCLKDDESIKEEILKMYNNLSLYIDKENFLETYMEKYFRGENLDKDINKYFSLIQNKIAFLRNLVEDFSYYVENDYYQKLLALLEPLFLSSTYDDVKNNISIKMPILKNASEDAKSKKESISSLIKEISSLCSYESQEQIKEIILSTKDYTSIIIEILKKLDESLTSYKKENDLYEFQDIALLSIQILEENEEVREELKYYFNEIMIDEYQDTSDIQEYFIHLIENNNVYMVGDIKQSIYRFRNANPYIFKNKYDNYSKHLGGMKIDLNKNFRTRKEPINDINLIFNVIMDNLIGGAEYAQSHKLVFGNTSYEENKAQSQNNHLEIYKYPFDKESIFSKDEIEAFIVGEDIKKKIQSQYQILDKETGSLRTVTYSDFVILMDRATKFDLYKKIFEYLNIPLKKHVDENIMNEYDILIIKNIINLIIHVHEKNFDTEFKYTFTSVGRSYLMEYSDEEIFDYLTKNTFYQSTLFQKAEEITNFLDNKSISFLLEKILDTFSFYQKLNKVGNVEKALKRMEYIINLGSNLSSLGYTIYDFSTFLDNLIENGSEIKVAMKESASCAVNIMTIHKSKGLEYGVCYYTGLFNKFNIQDINERFLLSNRRIITPYYQEGIGSTIYKELLKENYIEEEISEKIRLFYVALTRCREKMILLLPEGEELEKESFKIVPMVERLKYRSFLDIMYSVASDVSSYFVNINLEDAMLSKDYNLVKKESYASKITNPNQTITYIENEIPSSTLEKKHFSKTISRLITKEEKEKLQMGTDMHYLLEVIDFKKKDLSSLSIPEFYLKKISSFLEKDIFEDINHAKIYKEYEFSYQKENEIYQGIIDLMIEKEEEIIIVDYKLKNIEDPDYIKQLTGYYEYIKQKTTKPISVYLYSIFDEQLKQVI